VPPNDNWANRAPIAQLPFTAVETDVATATVEASDPIVVCRNAVLSQTGNTLWYSYTTGSATEYLTLSTAASDYDTTVSVYEGTPGSFRMVHGGCNDDGVAPGVFQSRIVGLRLQADRTYSIEVTNFEASTEPARLELNVAAAATYAVTRTDDGGTGGCDADCSLREAVVAANQTPGAVLVPAGHYTLAGAAGENGNAGGDLDVTAPMAIYGAGADVTVVDAVDRDRVIHGDPAGQSRSSLTLGDLTLRDGNVTGDGAGCWPRASATTPTSIRSSSTRRSRAGSAAACACRAGAGWSGRS
jgi:CSLREA domain-containing protein